MKNTIIKVSSRIKVCGITTPEDARMVSDSGVDAIGLVFYPGSPRAVTIAQAENILSELSPFVSSVGLFVDAGADEINEVLSSVPLDLLQFHGDESEAFCASFSRPYIKALRVRPEMDIAALISSYSSAKAILLDAWHPNLAGGTGQQFDWDLLQNISAVEQTEGRNSLILAGGLKTENIAEAIKTVQPYAVDVSSGVETGPGQKSAEKVKQFVEEVKRV